MLRIGPIIQIHTSRTGAWRISAGLAGCYPHPHVWPSDAIGGFLTFFEGADSISIPRPHPLRQVLHRARRGHG